MNTSLQKILDVARNPFSRLNNHLDKNEKTILAGLIVITLYNLAFFIKEKRQNLRLPPYVPYGLPVFGHTFYMMFAHNKFIDWCNKNFGETYRISMFGETINVTSGRAAEESMKADPKDLSILDGTSVDLLHLDFIHSQDIFDIGQFVNPVITRDLLASSKMPLYIPTVLEGFARAKKDMINETQPTLISNPSTFFQNFVAYMSVPILVGDEFKENREIIKSFATCTNDAVKNAPLYIMFPKFIHPLFKVFLTPAKRHTDLMMTHIEPFVHKYRDNPNFSNKDSFIKRLSLFEYNGKLLPSKNAAQSILLLAFASVHTTSSTTSIALYWLLARPELLKQFMEEIERVFPNNAPITYEGLQNMTFLNNLLKETLRQSISSLSNRKKALRDYTFYNGYQVPKGGIVESTARAINLGLNMNRLGIDAMDPEMSMNKPITTPAKDFVTFGMGKHLCPGRFFATQEVKIMLIELFRNYDIRTVSGKRSKPYTDFFGIAPLNCEDPLILTPRL